MSKNISQPINSVNSIISTYSVRLTETFKKYLESHYSS